MARSARKEAQVSLETVLWNCRVALRGVGSTEKNRDAVIALVFLKFAGDKFKKRRTELLNQYGDIPVFLEKVSFYNAVNVFYLKETARWSYIVENASANNIAVIIDQALADIEESNPPLKGALPLNLFATLGADNSKIKNLIDNVNQIDEKRFQEEDLIGRVYEYFLQVYAASGTKEDGEFYTPACIVKLIAEMIEPYSGVVYDPCCGSGGMFIQCAKYVEAKQGDITGVNVFGQEKEPATFRLAKMNLAMRGISHHLGDCAKSTFEKDHHAGLAFDYIMANPPFNLKHWFKAGITEGVNWADYGTPPESNANYAWILHMLSKIKADKGIAGFLLANGALGDEDAQAIRQKLIEKDKVEAIIVLPRELFYTTDISVTLWILNQNKKGGLHHGRRLRDRTGEILFMDLRSWTENPVKGEQKKKVEIKPEQVERAKEIYFRWQQEGTDGETYAEPELYRSVGLKELGDNNYSLVPSRYIEFVDRDKSIDYDRVLSETAVAVGEMIELQKQNQDALAEAFTALGYALHK